MSWAFVAAGAVAVGSTALKKKGRRPGLSPDEQQITEKKSDVFGTLFNKFKEQSKNPYRFKMRVGEQEMYDKRARDIYGEERGKQNQSLMAQMNRTGSLSSGHTNYALGQFARDTLKDYQQFYFQDRRRSKEEAQEVQNQIFGQGQFLIDSKNPWERQTQVMNARNAQHNTWRNRGFSMAQQVSMAYLGKGLGEGKAKG